jgi:endoglucanase
MKAGVRYTELLRWSVLIVILGVVAAVYAQAGSSLAFERAQHLQRGINLSMWYAQTKDQSDKHIEDYTTPADFKLVHDLGFDHVRLSIDPEPLIGDPHMGSLRPDRMARLDKTVGQLLAAGLNIVLDIHPEQTWKDKLRTDEGVQEFYAFWTAFAGHFASTDPEHVFLEIMNEPNMDDLYRWSGIQAKAIARIRTVAPRHTLIASAAQWDGIDPLLETEPVADQNIIYSFHDYDPMWFTHQGATWAGQNLVYLRGVPYPSSPLNIQGVLDQEPDARARLALERYGFDRWDAARLGMEIDAASRWGQRRGVPLYCGEFGVYQAYAKPQDRALWINDLRTALERRHVGWAMWDYQGGFALVHKGSGGAVVDQDVLHALGLKQ